VSKDEEAPPEAPVRRQRRRAPFAIAHRRAAHMGPTWVGVDGETLSGRQSGKLLGSRGFHPTLFRSPKVSKTVPVADSTTCHPKSSILSFYISPFFKTASCRLHHLPPQTPPVNNTGPPKLAESSVAAPPPLIPAYLYLYLFSPF
jgi:hypothetical protein